MYLKSLTLKGFKSFPDRTRLEFGPGVSVVVGPNGSGKSNITDAVLWALGEQSPMAVRGQSMQDVIFGGAPGRQGASGAEVELVLDDSDGTLGLGVPEISVLRRLDRNGDGEYRLAGARCRLIDVIELLSDTGLGKEMHSVVSQGRVEAIVTSKPRDRRMLIEEAAGLGKHRKRRRRAQLKLTRAQQNLDRALDVEREVRSRLRPLKRQAEAAELHARLERQSLEARWELARDDLRARLGELTEAEQAVAAARVRRGAIETELQAVSSRREAAEEALAARSAEREELSRRSFRAQAAAERVSYRTDTIKAAARTVTQRLARQRDAHAVLERELAADQPDERAPARVAALEAELAALDRDRTAELERQLAELDARLGVAREQSAARAAEVAAVREQREHAERRSAAARAEIRRAEVAVEAARREAARVGGELAAVNQFLRSHAGAPGGERSLADEIEVDPGYELALAAVLDGRLSAALAPDAVRAAVLLNSAGRDGGRVLVAATADDSPSPDAAAAGPRAPGESAPPVRGAVLLAGRVRGTGPFVELARRLLDSAWVVDELDQLPADFAGIGVTRAGRVWSARTPELRQAPAVGEDRVLAERNHRRDLLRGSEIAVQAELDAKAEVAHAVTAASGVDSELQQAIAAQRAAVRDRDEAAEEESRLASMIERRRTAPDDGPQADRRAQLGSELSAQRSMLERAERDRRQRTARIERLTAGIARDLHLGGEIERLLTAIEAVAGAISNGREAFDQALLSDRAAGERVAAELRRCAQQEAELQTRLHRENETLTEAEVRAQRARDRADDAGNELRRLAERLGLEPEPASEPLEDDARGGLVARLDRLVRRREQLGPINPLAQQEYADAVAHVEELERQRADLEAALRELEKLIRDTDRQIRETFEEMFQATARNFEELVANLFPGGRGRLALVTERDQAPRVLGRTRSDGGEDRDGAGEGDCEDGSDDQEPEEDLLGVEIEITPAGKEMKRLTLLSGGEKSMTALAFLFAVFLARPCPFYILDEVEAALDDFNITRFLELLRGYSGRAQFIVVTHQKRTMEAADWLYGVTMGSDGISKVVSRRLPESEAAA